jgi:hypothetical protein
VGIGRGEVDGRALAHVASLLFLKSSGKVVRHTEWDSCCGRLWKTIVGGGLDDITRGLRYRPGTSLRIPDGSGVNEPQKAELRVRKIS